MTDESPTASGCLFIVILVVMGLLLYAVMVEVRFADIERRFKSIEQRQAQHAQVQP